MKEEIFKTIFEFNPDPIIVFNAIGEIVLINQQGKILFGYKEAELKGKRIDFLMPAELVPIQSAMRFNYVQMPDHRTMGRDFEILAKDKEGRKFHVEIALSPLPNHNDGLFIASIRDISVREETHRNLENRNSKLQQRIKEIENNTFLASHELQEPIRTIKSLSNLLEDNQINKLDAQSKTCLRFLNESSHRMNLLVKGLLDYNRTGINPVANEIEIPKVLDEVKEDLNFLVEETGANIISDRLPQIYGFETEIRALLQNLISNSIKFRKKETSPRIRISANKETHHWHFTIKDNGIGIPDRYQDKIFEMFYRLHPRSQYDGCGIGLAKCKKVVELHNGRIWVDSLEGHGSTFHFTISKN